MLCVKMGVGVVMLFVVEVEFMNLVSSGGVGFFFVFGISVVFLL